MNFGTFFFRLQNLFKRSFTAPMGQIEHHMRAPTSQLTVSIGHHMAQTSRTVTLLSGDLLPRKARIKIRLNTEAVTTCSPRG